MLFRSMLYIGETLGTMGGPELDIAVDPLEGTNFAANNQPGALSVIAVAEKSNLFSAPETYMNKISAKVPSEGIIDLDYSVKKNISNLADYKNKQPNELSACILDRPRHKKIIEELRNLKVNLKLILGMVLSLAHLRMRILSQKIEYLLEEKLLLLIGIFGIE